ncbi:MAG: hypothetical protein ACYDH6_17880 [Acidimicrobiales bacterium]
MPDERKSPLDQALDLLVFAPLGLALTVGEELPKLVEKGRQRTTTQVTMARMIGQFVVAQGQKELKERLDGLTGNRPAPPPSTPPAAPVETESANGRNGTPTVRPPSPPVESLAIHGYDSLSAPQVVQRLGGLSPAELAAVSSYEEATRGRRTILSKVALLQAEHG